MSVTSNHAPSTNAPAALSSHSVCAETDALRAKMEEDRARYEALMADPVIQEAARRGMEKRAAARAEEKARPAREAEAAYRLHVESGLRPLGLDDTANWPEPERFGPPPPPPFSPSWFAGPVAEFVKAAAVSFQVPVDLVAVLVLGAVCVAMLGKACVRVKADWWEPVQLFICAVLPPSERKSPVFARVFRAIMEWVRCYNDAHALEVAQSATRKRALEKALDRAVTKGEIGEVDRLTAELHSFNEVKPLTLTVGDVTAEAAAMLAADNGGRLGIVAPEGGVLGTALGRYSQTPNLDFLLNGFSGEPVSIHRVGREAVRIQRATLALVLAVQPAVLKELFSSPEAVGRGLAARILFACPEPMSGRRSIDAPDIPASVSAAYDDALNALLDLPTADRPRELVLTAEAAQAFHEWRAELERRRSDDLRPLECWGWGGKLDGLTLRLAATLAMLEDPHTLDINAGQLRRAVSIARWAIEHARAASASMPAASGSEPAAQVLLEALRRAGKAVISTREAHRLVQGKRAMFPNADAVRAALRALADRGYVRLGAYPERSGAGRPSEPLWIVSPRLNDPPPVPEEPTADEVMIL